MIRVLLCLCVCAYARHARAQNVGRACSGEIVTGIDVRVRAATANSESELEARARPILRILRFSTTRPDVVRAYLHIDSGKVCTELDRSESERILRAQPFIASAVVGTVPDGPGHARIVVDVVDEMPAVVGGGLHRGQPASLTLGTLNLMGRGLSVSVHATRGFAYRDGVGARIVQYGVLSSPYYVALDVSRDPLSDAMSLEFAKPYLTDHQRAAFRFGARAVRNYFSVARPVGPDVALNARRIAYDVGWVTRLGKLDRRHTAGFVGAALLGEDARISDAPVIVSDSGIVPAPDAVFGASFPDFAAIRIAAIGGLRSIRFVTVNGFDALGAQQDVGVGIQIHMLVGPSVWAPNHRGEVFASGDVYAGLGSATSFASMHISSEARGKYDSPVWEGMVTSARLSWYGRRSLRFAHTASLDMSAVRHLDFPAQLTFRDVDGGVAGFAGAKAAGGSRAVLRVEERMRVGLFRSRMDFALAGFAESGKLWAGEVPYGQTTPIRSALGVSLLSAFPAGGKRTYRVDIAFPLNPERGGARIEFRVSALDRTRLLWREPRDVSRVRSGAVPASLLRW